MSLYHPVGMLEPPPSWLDVKIHSSSHFLMWQMVVSTAWLYLLFPSPANNWGNVEFLQTKQTDVTLITNLKLWRTDLLMCPHTQPSLPPCASKSCSQLQKKDELRIVREWWYFTSKRIQLWSNKNLECHADEFPAPSPSCPVVLHYLHLSGGNQSRDGWQIVFCKW